VLLTTRIRTACLVKRNTLRMYRLRQNQEFLDLPTALGGECRYVGAPT